MHLLDSDMLTHWYAGNPRLLQRFEEMPEEPVGTTIISKIELLQGRFDFLLKASSNEEFLTAQLRLTQTEEFLAQIRVLPMDKAAVEVFQRLRVLKGLKKIGRADLLIGSISLSVQAALVTRNLRHFRKIPNLKVVNWLD
jgi:tRNA(fMet)-specific endonuclease VapC